MDVQVSVLVGVLMLIIAFLTLNRNREKDTREEASEIAIIKQQLATIISGIESIRVDIKANERRVTELSERVIRMDESLKSAHKRLDTLEIKKGVDKDE